MTVIGASVGAASAAAAFCIGAVQAAARAAASVANRRREWGGKTEGMAEGIGWSGSRKGGHGRGGEPRP